MSRQRRCQSRPNYSAAVAENTVQFLEERCLLAATLWTQRGADAGHTGYVDVALDPAAFVQAWHEPITFQPSTSRYGSAVAIDETHVYRTDLDGYTFNGDYLVQAFDLKNGDVVWRNTLQGNAHAGVGEPSVSGSIVYVNRAGHSASGLQSGYPRLYGFNAETGDLVVEQIYSSQWGSNERPVIRDNQLVVENGYLGGIRAYTASTLTAQWFVDGSIYDPPSSALDDEYVYAYGNQVYRRSNGQFVRHQANRQGLELQHAVVSSSGRILYDAFGSNGSPVTSFVTALDGDTHAMLWTNTVPDMVSIKAVGNGIVAVVAGSQLILLDELTGRRLRSWQGPNRLAPEIVLTRTHAFVQSFAGIYGGTATIHAIELTTGNNVWNAGPLSSRTYDPTIEMAMGSGYLLLSHEDFLRAYSVTVHVPQATNDQAAIDEDTSISLQVMNNDHFAGTGALTVTAAGPAAHGAVAVSTTGIVSYVPEANYFGDDQFSYTISDPSGHSDTATVFITVRPVADAPVAVAGEDQTGDEDDLFVLNGRSSIDVDDEPSEYGFDLGYGTTTVIHESLVYRWDFGDGTTALGSSVTHKFSGGRTYAVSLTVTDNTGRSSSDSLMVSVVNLSPVLQVYGQHRGVRGEPRFFAFVVDDASRDRLDGPFTYSIQWGDGSQVQTIQESDSVQIQHTFSANGWYSVSAQVVDKDGIASAIVAYPMTISTVVDDGSRLTIGGTPQADTIGLRPSSAISGGLVVTVNGAAAGTYSPGSRILIYGQAGDDLIQLQPLKTNRILVSAIIFSGSGNDVVDAWGSVATNALVGGDGADVLRGGDGRDLMIGGAGRDTLRGRGGDDILIGGATVPEFSDVEVDQVLSEWKRSNVDFARRVDHLSGVLAGGFNAGVFLNSASVLDDRATDQLFGDDGSDWVFGMLTGQFRDVLGPRRKHERLFRLFD